VNWSHNLVGALANQLAPDIDREVQGYVSQELESEKIAMFPGKPGESSG
jgi:hypothetical protein